MEQRRTDEITTSDVGKIIYNRCRSFGVKDMIIAPNVPFSEITSERLVIIVGDIHYGTIWNECEVRVNWLVPNIADEPSALRMDFVKGELLKLSYGIDEFNERYYKFRKEVYGDGEDKDMRCHFAKITLSFKIQNIQK